MHIKKNLTKGKRIFKSCLRETLVGTNHYSISCAHIIRTLYELYFDITYRRQDIIRNLFSLQVRNIVNYFSLNPFL
jgi:hypothetical protein